MLRELATKPLQFTRVGIIAGIDLCAGLLWATIAIRTWLMDTPGLAFLLLALATLMVVAAGLIWVRSTATYALALAANLLMAGRMIAVSTNRILTHLRGEQIPGYWVPISGTVFSLLQVLLFLVIAWHLFRMLRSLQLEHRQELQDDLGAAGGWDTPA